MLGITMRFLGTELRTFERTVSALNCWGYPKSCCLSVGYVLLAGLLCLASVGEEAPSLAVTWSARVGGYPEGPHLPRGEGEGE